MRRAADGYTEKCDLFSAAVVLCQMTSGYTPLELFSGRPGGWRAQVRDRMSRELKGLLEAMLRVSRLAKSVKWEKNIQLVCLAGSCSAAPLLVTGGCLSVMTHR